MKSAEQEALVAEIVEALAGRHTQGGCAHVGHGNANKLPGASGFRHQIDVSAMLGGDLALYECKRWGRNVGPSAVLTFAARVIDIRDANPGLQVHPYIVVNRALTKGAKNLAEHFKIDQLAVKSPTELVVSFLSLHDARVQDEIQFRG